MVVVLRSANRRGCKLEYDQPFQKKKKKMIPNEIEK